MSGVLHIKQKKEILEIFSDLETRNQYEILDSEKNLFGYAAEEGNSMARFFLKSARPLNLHITDSEGKKQLIVKKFFAFFLPKYEIYSADDKFLGAIKTRFSFLKKRLDIFGPGKEFVYNCEARIPHIWTFNVYSPDKSNVCKITKKWSGFGTEAFTDADTFHVDFKNIPEENKNLILSLAFAVDLNYFEKGG